MVTQAVVFALVISVVKCHYFGNGYFGQFGQPYPYGHHDYSHHAKEDETKQKFCDKENPCPDDGVCCLKGFSGRCYYGSYSYYYGYKRKEPEVSETCIKDFGGSGKGSKCSTDLECAGSLVCEDVSSNKWGVCKDHICWDRERENPCNGGCCRTVSKPQMNGRPDYITPEFTCDCFRTDRCDLFEDVDKGMEEWKIGKYCEKPHPCSDPNMHLCGDNGECERDPNDPEAMVCKCDPDWYGEKCNHEGACLQKENACLNEQKDGAWTPKDNGAVCVSLSATANDHKCDCSDVDGYHGANCETPVCGCENDGLCIEEGNGTFDDSNIFQKTGRCECPFNYYGETCENDCGGEGKSALGTNSSEYTTIDGSDAVCIFKDITCDSGSNIIKISIRESSGVSTDDDPYCHKYFFEVFSDASDGDEPYEAQTSTGNLIETVYERNRYCISSSEEDEFVVEFTGPCSDGDVRVLMQLKKGQEFSVVLE